jgi:hypothetical protein
MSTEPNEAFLTPVGEAAAAVLMRHQETYHRNGDLVRLGCTCGTWTWRYLLPNNDMCSMESQHARHRLEVARSEGPKVEQAVRQDMAVVVKLGWPIPESPRLPAVEPVEPPAGPETGTGGLNRHRDAEAGDAAADFKPGTPAEWIMHADRAPLFRTEPDFPPATIPHEAMPHLAGFINALKASHLHEAAASLRAIAEHMPDTSSAAELRPGIRYAATLLGHTATDLEDGDG